MIWPDFAYFSTLKLDGSSQFFSITRSCRNGAPKVKNQNSISYNKSSSLRYIIITIYGIWIAYYCIPQFLGSLDADVAWLLADFSGVFNIICTVTILFVLRKEVFRLGNDFFERFLPAKERGENPEPVVYEEVA